MSRRVRRVADRAVRRGLDSGSATIPIGNMTWATTGVAGFNATGTMNTTAQPVGNWTGPGARTGSQTYTLLNDWAFMSPANYTVTLTYTLTSP